MKKSDWIIFVAILVVVMSYFGYRSYTRTQTRNQREHHIFCESLAAGMSPEEVLNSLKKFGEIEYNKTDVYESGADDIVFGYKDSHLIGPQTYLLWFTNGKYTGVSVIVGLEDVDSVCKE